MSTQKWLQRTVYDRSINKLGSSKSAMLVFMCSAFWHGFYPIWYMVFFAAFWMNELQRLCFKNEAKLKKIPWVLGFVFSQVFHSICMNFCGVGIQNSKFDETWRALRNYGFIIFWPTILVFALPHYIKFVHIVLGKPKEEAKVEKKAE